MKNRKITLLIQPSRRASSGRIRSSILISFPKRIAYYIAIGAVLLVVFGVSGSWNIRDNVLLLKKIESVRSEMKLFETIDVRVASIRKEEAIIRQFLGLDSWDAHPEINNRLGRGGYESSDDYVMTSLDMHDELPEMNASTAPLHARVHDLQKDVHELISILSKRTEKLNHMPTVMPVRDKSIWITSGFGWRKSPFTGLREFHKGLDISGRKGAPIIATADGIVKKVGYNRFIGNYVRLTHDGRFSTGYGHLLEYTVKKNQQIKRGQIIGYMGTSGMSTGYHLHYEVVDNDKRVNPYNFILNRNEHSLTALR